ncbi:hypothetical protein DLAC_02179 [Tieghemostelium lacteum]|uniref:Uncharacterized protein n=1 Tax=Tieghemostelium lacteum TaxID=361077 RepID=A0A152A491_TIELA|nr:hypothetical protein DLAC_02179 [Tieghemostelium lacteum]|eukprot:KYR01082.1 hypothetical protein DLAC_02179 [Tieghemostelium lacteum]
MYQTLCACFDSNAIHTTIMIFNEWVSASDQKRLELYNIHVPKKTTFAAENTKLPPLELLRTKIGRQFQNKFIYSNEFIHDYYDGWTESEHLLQRIIGYLVILNRSNTQDIDRVYQKVTTDLEAFEYISQNYKLDYKISQSLFPKILNEIPEDNNYSDALYSFILQSIPEPLQLSNISLLSKLLKLNYHLISKHSITKYNVDLFTSETHLKKLISESGVDISSAFQKYSEVIKHLYHQMNSDYTYFSNQLKEISKQFPEGMVKKFSIDLLVSQFNDPSKSLHNSSIIHFLYLNFNISASTILGDDLLQQFILTNLQKSSHSVFFNYFFNLIDQLQITDEIYTMVKGLIVDTKIEANILYAQYKLIKVSLENNGLSINGSDFINLFTFGINVYSVSLFIEYFDYELILYTFLTKMKNFQQSEYDYDSEWKYCEKIFKIIKFLWSCDKTCLAPSIYRLYQYLIDICKPTSHSLLTYLQNYVYSIIKSIKLLPDNKTYRKELILSGIFYKDYICKHLIQAAPYSVCSYLRYKARPLFNVILASNLDIVLGLSRRMFISRFTYDSLKNNSTSHVEARLTLLRHLSSFSVGLDGYEILCKNIPNIQLLKLVFKEYTDNGPPDKFPPSLYEFAEISLRANLDLLLPSPTALRQFYQGKNNEFTPSTLYSNFFPSTSKSMDSLYYKLSTNLNDFPFKSLHFREWFQKLPIHFKLLPNSQYFLYQYRSYLIELPQHQQQQQQEDLPTLVAVVPQLPKIVYQHILNFIFMDMSIHKLEKLKFIKVSKLFLSVVSKLLEVDFSISNGFLKFPEIHKEHSILKRWPNSILNLIRLRDIPLSVFKDYMYNQCRFICMDLSVSIPIFNNQTNLKSLHVNVVFEIREPILNLLKHCPLLESIKCIPLTTQQDFNEFVGDILKLQLPNLKNLSIEYKKILTVPRQTHLQAYKDELKNKNIPTITGIFSDTILDITGFDIFSIETDNLVETIAPPLLFKSTCMEHVRELNLTTAIFSNIEAVLEIIQPHSIHLQSITLYVSNLSSPPFERVQSIFEKLASFESLNSIYFSFYLYYRVPIYDCDKKWSNIDLKSFKKSYNHTYFYKNNTINQ